MGRHKIDKTSLKPGDLVLVMHIGPCVVKGVDEEGVVTLEKGSYWGGTVEFKEYADRCIKIKNPTKPFLDKMSISKKIKLL